MADPTADAVLLERFDVEKGELLRPGFVPDKLVVGFDIVHIGIDCKIA